mmetsp:Transcript_24694/g.68724  ORF Transcript_24694/g.68724 Transcript_24694/m.68724 type:complete len:363 (-) Transcript_24694:1122-2210(-)
MMRAVPMAETSRLRSLAAVEGPPRPSKRRVAADEADHKSRRSGMTSRCGRPSPSPEPKRLADQRYRSPVIGRRVYTDGRTAGFQQGLISRLVAVVTLALYVAWIPLLLVVALMCWWHRCLAALAVLLASTLAMPATMRWQPLLDSYVMRTWREYFNFSYVLDGGIDQQKSYILAEFPHGAFPLGPIVSMSAVNECLFGQRISGVGASILFWIPGYYHFLTWVGGLPATKSNILKFLKKGWVAVTVGGIAEMFIMKPDQERIYLRKRRGVVRIAVQTGTDIIPVYHFGNTQVRAHRDSPPHPTTTTTIGIPPSTAPWPPLSLPLPKASIHPPERPQACRLSPSPPPPLNPINGLSCICFPLVS